MRRGESGTGLGRLLRILFLEKEKRALGSSVESVAEHADATLPTELDKTHGVLYAHASNVALRKAT